MNEYRPEDNLVHAADADDAHFQDSHWVMWMDEAQGVAGMHRLAVHPNAQTSNFWCGVFAVDRARYRNSGWDLPWTQPTDLTYRVSEGQSLDFTDGGFAVRVSEPGCEVDLTWASSRPMFAYLNEQMATDVASNHFEGAGRLQGTVTLGDETFEVNAVAFRDRSWGTRLYNAVRSHRWFAGTFGEDLCFSATAVVAVGGRMAFDGILVEDGKHYRTADIDIVVHQEVDSLTHRGGELVMRFPDRADFRVDATVIDGAVFPVAGGMFHNVDTICIAKTGDRVGFCNVEASNHLFADGPAPILGLRANITDGLSRHDSK